MLIVLLFITRYSESFSQSEEFRSYERLISTRPKPTDAVTIARSLVRFSMVFIGIFH